MDRSILHCDLNNFYASAESVGHEEYKSIPLVVGGDEELRHGIVLAKNEIAKKYGIKTGEALWEARKKCPEVKIVPPNFPKYLGFSRQVREIYERYTDMVEPFGIDECWLDVTGSTFLFGSPQQIASRIMEEIKKETDGLTISVGVSYNKIFAKLGSDYKKPDGLTVITRENYQKILWPLEVEALMGVGRATSKRLRLMGISTVGQLAQLNQKILNEAFGKNGLLLWGYANGYDCSPVIPTGQEPQIKSIGRSTTTPRDLENDGEVWRVILALSEEVAHTLRKEGLRAGGVQVHIRDNRLCVSEYQKNLETAVQTCEDLSHQSMELFCQGYSWRLPIRSIGVRAFHLTSEESGAQTTTFFNAVKSEKWEALEDKVDIIRDRYGRDALKRAIFVGAQDWVPPREGGRGTFRMII